MNSDNAKLLVDTQNKRGMEARRVERANKL